MSPKSASALLVAVFLALGFLLSRRAQAEPPREAECFSLVSLAPAAPTAEWMMEQLAKGRTHFIVASNAGIAPLCAW
jgi:hypothetical protein